MAVDKGMSLTVIRFSNGSFSARLIVKNLSLNIYIIVQITRWKTIGKTSHNVRSE